MDRTDLRLLFLDLDGTLLDDGKEISPGNRRALERALRAGHRVVITTGRALSSAKIQAQRLGLDRSGCYLITFNGAVVYDCGTESVLSRTFLDPEALYAVFDEANRRGVCIVTYSIDEIIVESRNDGETAQRYCAPLGMDYRVADDIRTELTAPSPKALIVDFDDHSRLEGMRDWIETHLSGRADCFFSNRSYLEVVPAGMNKGQAVIEMCRRLNVPISNAIAVGDEANDLSMIQAAGIGVAMANGTQAVKAAADYVTERDNNHDGVAEVVERFCFGNVGKSEEKRV